MALSFECERCGAAGSVRGEAGTPTLVKCSGCGNTFITGGPLGAPKVQGGVRAPAVPIAMPKSPPVARSTPLATPASRPPTPMPTPKPPSRTLPPLDAPAGPDRWAKSEIDPDAVPPPDGGYVDFTLDDDPPAAPTPAAEHVTPPPRAAARTVPVDTPAPFPRREPTRELPRPERTPPSVAAPERTGSFAVRERTGEARVPAFAAVTPPPSHRKWVPFVAVGGVGLALGAIVAVIATRDPVPAPAAPAADAVVAVAAPAPSDASARALAPGDPAPVPQPAPAPAKPVAAAVEPKAAPARAVAPLRSVPERRTPPATERVERTVTRRAPAATEPSPVPVPAASPPATAPATAAVTTAVFSPPPEAPAAPQIEDAPVYPSDGFRRPTAADPSCVQRSLRLPRDLQDRVPDSVPVRFAVGPDGALSQFSVIAQVADRRVGEAIWSAVRSCKFNPGADARGRSVRLWVVMPIRFVGR
jgi:hypothetical protein